ncbi:MAG: hypothetical protein WDN01_03110 [Rhizomicrobium sp.]
MNFNNITMMVTCAQIGRIERVEEDSIVNPLGIKGVGELGNVGMNAAVVNAVYHATGKRVRHIPVRLEDIL